ncbi:MAG: primosomal protein N' [Cyanobacteriota bacterium]|mgnify:CR=1 FL=1
MKYLDYNYAEVLIDVHTDLESQTFTYAIPSYLKNKLSLGTPVIVPIKENQVGGYIVGFQKENPLSSEIKIKEILAASDNQILSEKYIELIKWVAEYYHTNFLTVLKTAIPSGILTKAKREIELVVSEEEFKDYIELNAKNKFKEFCDYLIDHKSVRASTLRVHFGPSYNKFVRKLLEIDYIKTNFTFENKSKHKKHIYISFLNELDELSKREKEILSLIKKENGFIRMKDALVKFKTSEPLLKNLEEKGCITISKEIVLRKPQDYNTKFNSDFVLNPSQKNALDKFIEIRKSDEKNKNILLFGVTGSGKTEVYIKCIEYVLNEGKNAIVLVPEISLTPQTVSRFRSRFGDCIAVLHSGLNEGEKFDEWQRIKNGDAKIIIGARSAVFAPVVDLGVIIIDEEHESSYKQENNPKYNAKTVAIKRAELDGATIILGSATPCIESYYNANNNKNWVLLNMPDRVKNQIMPKVMLIDMKKEFSDGNKGIFSRELKNAIEDRLLKKEQIILFINRRGFSTFVMCRECGYSVKCKNCSVSMVYHTDHEILKCHYCGERESIPLRCPKCKSPNIRHFGIGTQKIETFAKKLFYNAKIVRMDKDTTSKKDAHFDLLAKFANGEYDILIGTQMVAKGLDFPNVTLVGIITADTAINLPDFRAEEKTFQLITQVSGRSGRGDTKGEVFAQGFSLDHISIQSASKHDFERFYKEEIVSREMLSYPPFSNLVNIIVANFNENLVKKDAKIIGDFLKKNISKEIRSVLGPIPAGVPKIKEFYRYQILIKTFSLDSVRELLRKTFKEIKIEDSSRIGIDIDPMNMM